MEAVADEVVVVDGAPGVARDAALAGGRFVWSFGCVGQGEHDDAADAVENVARVAVGFAAIGQIVHLAGVAGVEPLVEAGCTGWGDCGADAAKLEAEGLGLLFEVGGEFFLVHGEHSN